MRVTIPFTNERVHEEERVRPEVFDWLKENADGFRGWGMHDAMMAHPGGGKRQYGHTFDVFEPDIAVMFKLAWGGE